MICIDTGVLIWGVRGTDDRDDLVKRCRHLIDDHKRRKISIMVPSIVLAEYLAKFDGEDQKIQRKLIGENFFVAPFDNAGAAVCGELFDLKRVQAIQSNNTPRSHIYADLKIISTAIAHSATHIYTDNVVDFKSLANGRIQVFDIPTPMTQANFLGR